MGADTPSGEWVEIDSTPIEFAEAYPNGLRWHRDGNRLFVHADDLAAYRERIGPS